MRYIWQHINNVTTGYNGTLPLTHFLKNYYRQNKQLGSRDRKIITEMLYCWYRCSKALPEQMKLQEKIQTCLFLCDTTVPPVLNFLPQEWLSQKHLPLEKRIDFLKEQGIPVRLANVISFQPELSTGISVDDWLNSLLQQPRLFIRIRKHRQQLLHILKEQKIEFSELSDSCLSLPNGAAIDKILPQEYYVVQDASSQGTGNYFHPHAREDWWDCCSGAGGKSLLLKDLQPNIQLTVSDKRASILHNLSERFALYQHRQPNKIVVDLTDNGSVKNNLSGRLFDKIISDVPCSGSGTWGRTPEQLYFFSEEQIANYSDQQKAIAVNACKFLKPGGHLFYITCSVFRKENEEVIDFLLKNNDLQLESIKLINGIDKQADSMFIAVLRK